MAKLPQLNYKPIIQWPGELTKSREYSRFKSTWGKTLTLLQRELDYLEAENVVFQVAVPEGAIRLDGGIKAGSRNPEHPGVIVSFDSKHGPLSYYTDLYTEFTDNVRAVALALEALRTVDRYGVNKKGSQYAGYKQLPPAGKTGDGRKKIETAQEAADFLSGLCDVPASLLLTNSGLVDFSYKNAAKQLHPDTGSTDEDAWIDLQDAAAVLRKHHGL